MWGSIHIGTFAGSVPVPIVLMNGPVSEDLIHRGVSKMQLPQKMQQALTPYSLGLILHKLLTATSLLGHRAKHSARVKATIVFPCSKSEPILERRRSSTPFIVLSSIETEPRPLLLSPSPSLLRRTSRADVVAARGSVVEDDKGLGI